MNKKTILYVGNFSFPFGNASGKRVYANGKLLKDLGYKVIFIGVDKEVERLKPLKNTHRVFDGFDYYNFPYPKSYFEWIGYKNVFKELIIFLNEENLMEDLALIIYYGTPRLSIFNKKLINYCNKNNIKVVADCVDWLSPKTNSIIYNLVKWMDNTYQKAYVNKKADGIIAISRYLNNYYNIHGCKTVIIPPLSPIKYDVSHLDFAFRNKKVISYAGQPFGKGKRITNLNSLKDRIDKTIVLLHAAKKKGCEFIFNIYGLTKEEYLYSIPSHSSYIEELGDSICFNGTMPNEEIVDRIKKSDFTILIRDVNRDTTAGFPTKVSESISCGTPVITTKTSDLEEYIIEGKNGYFIDLHDKSCAMQQLINILNQTSEKVYEMKKECLKEGIFYYEKFKAKVGEFVISLFDDQ